MTNTLSACKVRDTYKINYCTVLGCKFLPKSTSYQRQNHRYGEREGSSTDRQTSGSDEVQMVSISFLFVMK